VRRIAIALLLCAAAWGQSTDSQPISTNLLTLPVFTLNAVPVPGANLNVVGVAGQATYCYWAVANFQIGSVLSSLGCVSNGPNTLSTSNYVSISPWTYPPGATVDILRTSNQVTPTGACNCAVTTGLSSGAANDQLPSLSSYAVTLLNPDKYALTLTNEVVGSGETHLILRQGLPYSGLEIADLSEAGTGGTISVNTLSVPSANFNDTTPTPGANGINLHWQTVGANVSAQLVGNGNVADCLSGIGTYVACSGGTAPAGPTVNGIQTYLNSTTLGGSLATVSPGGSILDQNLLDNIVYVAPSDNWSQSPSGTIAIGANTVSLVPCPRGIATNNFQLAAAYTASAPWSYVYVAGTGTPEADLITGTTCTLPGGANGTITFTATGAHSAGYTVGTATYGVQEAVNASLIEHPTTLQPYWAGGNVIVPSSPNYYTWYATLGMPMRQQTIQFAFGAKVICNMLVSQPCLDTGDPGNFSRGGVGNIIENFQADSGVSLGQFPMIQDDGQATLISDTHPFYNYQRPSGASFGSLIQIDKDYAATINNLDLSLTGSAGFHCGSDFCTVAVLGTAGDAGVIHINNSNISMQCGGNGVDNQGGNTLSIFNTVIQGYSQFGIRSTAEYGDLPALLWNDVYEEIGTCQNPLGLGVAGVIIENGTAEVHGGVGPAGQFAIFNGPTTGGQVYYYYVVPHTSSGSGIYAPPLLVGTATAGGTSTPNILWYPVGATATITYDVLRSTNTNGSPAPYGSLPGGSVAANGAVATGLAQTSVCSGSVCSFTDNLASATAAYSVAPPSNFFPSLTFWPGGVVLTTSGDTNAGPPSSYYTDYLSGAGGGIVSSFGTLAPSVFAKLCDADGGVEIGVWVHCEEYSALLGATTLLNTPPPGSGAVTAGLKGREIFTGPSNLYNQGELITLVDCNNAKTVNTILNRPTWDACDSYIGLDQTSTVNSNNVHLDIVTPVSLSLYFGVDGTGTGWTEQTSATGKTLNAPLTLNGNLLIGAGYSCIGTACGPLTLSGTQIADNFVRANGPLGSNWTTVDGTWSIASNNATFTQGSDNYAMTAYTGSTFQNNQYASVTITSGGGFAGVATRLSSSAETGYLLICEPSTSTILKFVAGTGTSLGTGAGCSPNDTLTLWANGTTLTAFDNGVQTIQVTNSAIASGYPGMAGADTSVTMNNFRAGALNYSSSFQLTLLDSVTFGSAIDQTAASTTAGSCSMVSATSCTFTIAASYATPICQATLQGTGAVIAGECSVSGTTVTITAATSNSDTWAAWVVGNPN
jgi:hypothetical protein